MKKLFAAFLTAVLAFTLATPAFAKHHKNKHQKNKHQKTHHSKHDKGTHSAAPLSAPAK
jgi:hypothetical protein